MTKRNDQVLAEGSRGAHHIDAPPPQRSISLTGQQPDAAIIDPDTRRVTNPPGDPSFDPAPRLDGPDFTPQSSPPPDEPDLAAQLAEYKQRYGEALEALGKEREALRQQHAQALEEMRIGFDAALSQRGNPGPDQEQLPPGLNPDDTPSWGQIHQLFQNVPAMVQAQAIQATWDVTPQEYQEVMVSNPGLAQVAEPQRTKLIQRSVNLMRQRQGNGAQNPNGPPPAAGTQATPPSRDLRTPVVPHVEGGTGSPPISEPSQSNALVAAQREYAEASKIPDLKERGKRQKAAWLKVMQAQGVDPDSVAKSSFSVSG